MLRKSVSEVAAAPTRAPSAWSVSPDGSAIANVTGNVTAHGHTQLQLEISFEPVVVSGLPPTVPVPETWVPVCFKLSTMTRCVVSVAAHAPATDGPGEMVLDLEHADASHAAPASAIAALRITRPPVYADPRAEALVTGAAAQACLSQRRK
jgi:hypothetical protein